MHSTEILLSGQPIAKTQVAVGLYTLVIIHVSYDLFYFSLHI